MQIESEIERRIELLRALPSFKGNGWSISVSCQWLSTRVKIVSVTILQGRFHNCVMTVSRDSENVFKAINEAFICMTNKIEKIHEKRDTGQSGMAMD